MEKLKRYIIFLIGLFINSLGVSLITKADLGTSPISSIPYVLSLNFPMTLGQFTILFGYFIDLTMVLLTFVHPQAYGFKIVYLLIGCVILGFGVYMEVLANVAMLPGESFVRAVSTTWNTNFGNTKVAFDVSLTVIAAILSFLFAKRLDGVREGTIIAALLVGFIARLFGKYLAFLNPILFPAQKETSSETETGADSASYFTVDDSSLFYAALCLRLWQFSLNFNKQFYFSRVFFIIFTIFLIRHRQTEMDLL